MLYPLKFKPIVKPKVWGQESWIISAYNNEQTVVENGFLAGNTLGELIEIYMDELVGGAIYQIFGDEFPLLFKTIDAQDDLSVQVHPDDMAAAEVEQLGKSEMWYVSHADPQASIILGFNRATNREEVATSLEQDTIMDTLQIVPVQQGDVAFVEAGLVHALRKGTQVVEIQQSSDLTYRLYDYRRPGLDGQLRELHVDQALNCLNYDAKTDPLVNYDNPVNSAVSLVEDEHFCTNILHFDKSIHRDYDELDSFVVYVCVEGQVRVEALDGEEGESITLMNGEAVLIPASLKDIRLTPDGNAKVLEVYVI
ncbi:MAG: class I mannose-6-phosphate isomerase [Paludibacteraceae bacterium]|nr:class I mannose-6-phosphate isomerase [Paludibacteraceae bacterium]